RMRTAYGGRPMRRSRSWKRGSERRRLLQLGVLGFGPREDRDVRVGVFCQREEILVGCAAFGRVASSGVGAAQTEMRQRKQGIERKAHALLQHLLKLLGRLTSFAGLQVGFAACIERPEPHRACYRGAFVPQVAIRAGGFEGPSGLVGLPTMKL